MTLVAIHQPNFFPWLGFFDKIARSDVFVLMDNVQFPTRSWVNRVRLLVNGAPMWATAPVEHQHGQRPLIAEVEVDETQDWRRRLVRTIERAYGRSPHFRAHFPGVEALVLDPESRLAEYNASAVRSIASMLELDTRFLMGTQVHGEGSATDLLVSMVRSVGGTAYLCGAGSSGYQDDAQLERAGIAVVHQQFEHPVYPQRSSGPFVPGLSVIDALMNWGADPIRRFLAERTGAGAGSSGHRIERGATT